MKVDLKKISVYSLLLGMTFLAIGIATDKTIFSMAAIIFVLLSLLLGGRWMRPRKK